MGKEKKQKRDKREEEAAEEAAVEEAAPTEAEAAAEEEAVEETPEERAARKAAKRARKEEKRRRKAERAAAEEAEAAAAAAASSSSSSAAADGDKASKKRKRQQEAEEAEEAAAAPKVRVSVSGSGLSSASAPATKGDVRFAFYKPSKAVAAMDAGAIAAFRKERNITVEDPHSGDAWAPIAEFAHAGDNFSAPIMSLTAKFKTPSPVQAQCWPIQLSGRDVVGIAATGSGKTLAFLLPAFVHIGAQRPLAPGPASAGPVCLVLAPTRELAMQTAEVAAAGGAIVGLKSTCIYGGVPKDEQRKVLRAGGGVHVVVATPGRLLDLIQEGSLSLARVTYLVLDEADRMLDMGFEKEVRSIVGHLSAPARQTVMFSATWPPAIQGLAAEFMRNPVKVTIGHAELAASHSVTQYVEVIEPAQREAALLRLLAKYHSSRKNRVLVFALYKLEAARLERTLQARGWNCVAIHGDMTQDARTRAFNAFKSGQVPLLVATDVAARGLDISGVSHVINATFPLTIEDYVHRIGRTGRGGATGVAHTLFTSLDKAHAGELVNVLREAKADVPPELLKFGTHIKKKEHSLYGAHFKPTTDGAPLAAPKKMTFGADDDE